MPSLLSRTWDVLEAMADKLVRSLGLLDDELSEVRLAKQKLRVLQAEKKRLDRLWNPTKGAKR